MKLFRNNGAKKGFTILRNVAGGKFGIVFGILLRNQLELID